LFVVPWADITMVDAMEAVCALVEALIKTATANLATTITQAQADPVSLFVVPWADITAADVMETATVKAALKADPVIWFVVPWANITVAGKVITVNAMETATARAAALKADTVALWDVAMADVMATVTVRAALKADLVTSLVVPWADVIMA